MDLSAAIESLKVEIPKYKVNNKFRGTAIIFDHKKYEGDYQDERFGTEFDCKSIQHTLKENLQFQVELLVNQKKDEIMKKVTDLAAEDHTESDCVLIVIMTHGGEGKKLCAFDCEYNLQDIISIMTSKDAHASLTGKPKACQGEKEDKGTEVAFHETNSEVSKKSKFIIPLNSDILIAYAATEGYASFRNTLRGSWFMQSLCKVFDNFGNDHDIYTLLMMVNRLVAREFGNKSLKQMPCISSMLTAHLNFPKK